MNTAEFIKDKQEAVLNYYSLQLTRNKHIDCPICEKKNKFRIKWYKGNISWICVCGNGNLFSLIGEVTGKDFKTIAREIDQAFGNVADFVPKLVPKNDNSWMLQFYRNSVPLKGTQGQQYLLNRGISTIPTGGVKFGSYLNSGITYPSLIAIASTEFREPRMLHITMLDGANKAALETPRKMHVIKEALEPISIKLFEHTDILGVAEGIETSLSIQQLYKIPTWSTINATYLKKFRAPTGVRTLYIFADNDANGTGLAAAFECGNKNLLNRNDVDKVVIRWPEKDNDFNDVILRGDKVVSWTLLK